MKITGEVHISPVSGARDAAKELPRRDAKEKGADSLTLLLFTVGSVCFGIDADQVAEIAAYDGELADNLFWIHEELDFGPATPVYRTPTVVTVRTGGGQPYRVIIDNMEDISEFRLNDIQPFPPLVEDFVLRRGMWGLIARNRRVVLLLDLLRLLKGRG